MTHVQYADIDFTVTSVASYLPLPYVPTHMIQMTPSLLRSCRSPSTKSIRAHVVAGSYAVKGHLYVEIAHEESAINVHSTSLRGAN